MLASARPPFDAVISFEIPRAEFSEPVLVARFERYHPARLYALRRTTPSGEEG